MTTITSTAMDRINGAASTASTAADEAGSADRFLKLLVTQMKNQDPLNPMDNAQMTSQIAQINTVSGIAQLNKSVEGLSSQFVQMQALQGASLIGKDVVVAGNKLDIENKVGTGGFELSSAADAVKVEVLGGNGQVLDTLNLGAQSSGMHSFEWPAANYTNDSKITFRVSASAGATPLTPTALMRDTVGSVSASGNELVLNLQRSGDVAYSKVKTLL
jgi:flagellar basal-body rod modification protein FlgD